MSLIKKLQYQQDNMNMQKNNIYQEKIQKYILKQKEKM